jgi:hypothetical protein
MIRALVARTLAPGLSRVAIVAMVCGLAGEATAQVAQVRGVFASGGASAGGGLLVRGALGQAAVGGAGGTANQACAGFWCVVGFGVVDAAPPGGDDGVANLAFALGAPTPNPSRAGLVRLDLTLPQRGQVRLDAFDVAGRRVGEPLEQAMDAGRWRLTWDGTRAGAGVYFLRLAVDGLPRGERRVVVLP